MNTMDDIRLEIENYIIEFVTKTANLNDIERPSDILNALHYDAIEDIKDRLWELIKYELDLYCMYYEIMKHKKEDTDDEEEKMSCDNETDEDD